MRPKACLLHPTISSFHDGEGAASRPVRARQAGSRAVFTSYNVTDGESLVVSARREAFSTQPIPGTVPPTSACASARPHSITPTTRSAISGITSGQFPQRDDPDAIARVLWRLTYEQYRKARQAYTNVKTKTAVRAKDEDDSPDFSQEKPSTYLEKTAAAGVSRAEDMGRPRPPLFRRLSPISAGRRVDGFLIASQGPQLPGFDRRHEDRYSRRDFPHHDQAETRADDGMQLMRVETFQFSDPAKVPSEAEVAASVKKMAADLSALRSAPLAEPYNGPALFSGRAAAVFFHEVLGHRVEGQRQRGRDEGQTFTKKVNEKIMPEFLSVTDDPTMRTIGEHGTLGLLPLRRRRHSGVAGRGGEGRHPEEFSDGAIAGEELQQLERSRPRPVSDRCRWAGRAI